MSDVIQQPYLPTSRKFPSDAAQLQPELTKMYVDVATNVNARVIGLFDQIQVVTGERWYNLAETLKRRQGYRKVITFGALAHNTHYVFPHGITGITQVTAVFGNAVATSAIAPTTRFIPLPYVSEQTASHQIEIYVSDTNVYINLGTQTYDLVSGSVVIEYLLN